MRIHINTTDFESPSPFSEGPESVCLTHVVASQGPWSSRPADSTQPVILPSLPDPHPTPGTCTRPDSGPANGSKHEANRIDDNGSTWNQMGVQPSFVAFFNEQGGVQHAREPLNGWCPENPGVDASTQILLYREHPQMYGNT